MEAKRHSAILFAVLGLLVAPILAFADAYGAGGYGAGTYAGVPATVTTQAATSISQTSVTLNGTITDVGTTSPSVRGFVYGADTTYGATTTDSAGPFSAGPFTASVSSLTCNTAYHFAAYATSTNGVGYGSDVSFITSACPVVSSGGGGGGGGGPVAGSIGSSPLVNLDSTPPAVAVATTSAAVSTSTVETATDTVISQLQTQIKTLQAQLAALLSKSQTAFTRNLSLNMTGSDVRALQTYLDAHGFPVAQSGPGSLGNETTLFGMATYRALMKFQAANALPATGYFGPQTRGAIAARPSL